ncbi:MAG: M48 family metallopeptidase [Ignavibacteria bacterium]|nr:M48 family metallopeptidase [Ignavibacteria bacterium]
MNKYREFKEEVNLIAKAMGLQPTEIHIRKMKRKIASCSSKGRLTISTEVLEKPKEKRYEIIIHELLHLRYPNHGKLFKLVLRNYLEKLYEP